METGNTEAYFTIFNTITGEITNNVMCPDEVIDKQLLEGESYIQGDYPGTSHYVSGEQAIDKANFPAQDTTINVGEELVIQVPNPTSYYITDLKGFQDQGTIDDGTFEFESEQRGRFRVELRNPKYKDMEFVIEVVDES